MATSLYRHFDANGVLLYVGVSLSALNRLGQHAEHSHWFKSISRVSIEHFENREAALRAEREAIQAEKPLHNIHHKRSDQVRRVVSKHLAEIAQSKRDLTARVVEIKPAYNIYDAANALGVQKCTVKKWMTSGTIGFFTIPNRNGRLVEYISGWQLIEFIESRVNESTQYAADECAAAQTEDLNT